jgi:hypothetical protein
MSSRLWIEAASRGSYIITQVTGCLLFNYCVNSFFNAEIDGMKK